MKILLTGSNGYIGKRLLPVLIDMNYEIVCCVRDINRFHAPKEIRDKVEIIELDLLKDETLKNIIKQNVKSDNSNKKGIKLSEIRKQIINNDHIQYSTIELLIDRSKKNAKIVIKSTDSFKVDNENDMINQGDQFWLLRCARELDDILLHLRFNELDLGVIIFSSQGSLTDVLLVFALEEEMLFFLANTCFP